MGHQPGSPPTPAPWVPLTLTAWPAALAEGPSARLTLLEDCVSLVVPPSAAESPEMTRALEKLLLPKRKLRVELLEEPRLDRTSASARSRTPRWPVVAGGGCECRDAAEARRESGLPSSRGARPCADEDVGRKGWRLSRIGPDALRKGGRGLRAPGAWTDWLLPFLRPSKESTRVGTRVGTTSAPAQGGGCPALPGAHGGLPESRRLTQDARSPTAGGRHGWGQQPGGGTRPVYQDFPGFDTKVTRSWESWSDTPAASLTLGH